MKNRVRGAFAFGWHYHKLKNGFMHVKMFPNSTFFHTKKCFDEKMFWLVSHDVKKFPNRP
jgi:hypothetical protein